MIISASRRTDLPRFYSQWFMNRIKAGFCLVANPFNPNQVSQISLKPEDVDLLVFWSKDPRPLLPHLGELEDRGFRYYFHYTLNGYPPELEPLVPPLEQRIETFLALSDQLSPAQVIWRYDPILLSNRTPPTFHLDLFSQIAQSLKGKTQRVIISLLDDYRGSASRLRRVPGLRLDATDLTNPQIIELIPGLVKISQEQGLQIFSCAEEGLEGLGVERGKCIDDQLIHQVFGLDLSPQKDRSQRQACGCIPSRDIGAYGTCHHQCVYCYAMNRTQTDHHPDSPIIVGNPPG